LTQDELKAEAEAEEARKQDEKRKAEAAKTAEIHTKFNETFDGTYKSVVSFLDDYRFKRGFEVVVAQQNADMFRSLPGSSLLLVRDFYTNYINLNTLNAKNLKGFNALQTVPDTPAHQRNPQPKFDLNWLEKREYTYEEIKALYNQTRLYVVFYNALTNQRVDDRLLNLRQITKKHLLEGLETDEEAVALAKILSEKPLYTRLREDFGHINGLTAADAIRLLLIHDKVARLVPQMKDRLDVALGLAGKSSAEPF